MRNKLSGQAWVHFRDCFCKGWAGWLLSNLFRSSLASRVRRFAVVSTGRKMVVEQMQIHQMKPYLGLEHQYSEDSLNS